jgi:hypothetical protein
LRIVLFNLTNYRCEFSELVLVVLEKLAIIEYLKSPLVAGERLLLILNAIHAIQMQSKPNAIALQQLLFGRSHFLGDKWDVLGQCKIGLIHSSYKMAPITNNNHL